MLAAARAISAHLERGALADGLIYDAVRVRLIEIGEAVKGASERRQEVATVTPDVWVDFNDITSTGETTTFLDYATPDIALAPGHTVRAGDGEGHYCRARVLSISADGEVRLALQLDTFTTRTGALPSPSAQGAPSHPPR